MASNTDQPGDEPTREEKMTPPPSEWPDKEARKQDDADEVPTS